MRANWHEWEKMQELAKRFSKHWRVGAPWLYLSSSGSPERNRQIEAQRLDPADVIELDRPNPSNDERLLEIINTEKAESSCGFVSTNDDGCLQDASHTVAISTLTRMAGFPGAAS
jgi:hypothetical protein